MPARRLGVRFSDLLAVLGVLALVLSLLAVLVAPAATAEVDDEELEEFEEEEVEPPDFEEVCAEDQPGADYCPETYEEPSWFRWLTRPLLIIGFILVTVLATAYLVYQPRFAREDEEEGASR
ncbi:hypothetical protein ER308_06835 [Egibacter rhizosphaerae]|uniref:Uncharacterized protein n=1 Tax=Egibacter rhizosphaerae TaxID=1670831 RepID=A0A411YDI0_9ACTN|nr:hypothetical protein [Egibacter rhizosphaerae]QBI19284.1 hypothetical protein ER308_06835 [Egibacter rhizosphaerae]